MIKFVVFASLCVALTLAQDTTPSDASARRIARQMPGMPSSLGDMPSMGVDMARQGARIGLGLMNPQTWLNEGKEIMENGGRMRKRRAASAQQIPDGFPSMPQGMPPMPDGMPQGMPPMPHVA